MAKIAILGFGTVGSGVYEVLCRNAAGVSRRVRVRREGGPVGRAGQRRRRRMGSPRAFGARGSRQTFRRFGESSWKR